MHIDFHNNLHVSINCVIFYYPCVQKIFKALQTTIAKSADTMSYKSLQEYYLFHAHYCIFSIVALLHAYQAYYFIEIDTLVVPKISVVALNNEIFSY